MFILCGGTKKIRKRKKGDDSSVKSLIQLNVIRANITKGRKEKRDKEKENITKRKKGKKGKEKRI